MLIFLRKIKKSLINSGSTQKYFLYAIGEIALVVIGILIALQINNWNEWNKDRNMERIVLEDIRDNIIRNNLLIASVLEIFDQLNQSTDIIKTAIEGRYPYSDTLNFHFAQSIKHGGFLLRLNYDGYESLKNIGFGIIQNEKLKDHILNLFEVSYSNYEIELQWGNSVYSGGYGWWKDYFYRIKEDLFIPIDYDKILNSGDFLSEINELVFVRETIKTKIKDCNDRNQLVLRLIEDELTKNGR